MPRVSVAMASYNHGEYVGEAIESVLQQTWQDFEFIIVDDGSTDGTATEIRRFQDSRIRFIPFEKNRGACNALNRAIQEGSGEYVAILNSDDLFFPKKLAQQVNFLDRHKTIDALFALPKIIDSKGFDRVSNHNDPYNVFFQPNRSRREWLRHFFFHGNCLCHPSLMIRRNCYQQVGYYNPQLHLLPDFDLWIRLALHGFNFHIQQEELIKFRVLDHERNASAPSSKAIKRAFKEAPVALSNFLNISLDEFRKIFPDYSRFPLTTNEFISFYIADLSINPPQQTSSPAHELFGIQLMDEVLRDPLIRNKLQSTYNLDKESLNNLALAKKRNHMLIYLKKCAPSWTKKLYHWFKKNSFFKDIFFKKNLLVSLLPKSQKRLSFSPSFYINYLNLLKNKSPHMRLRMLDPLSILPLKYWLKNRTSFDSINEAVIQTNEGTCDIILCSAEQIADTSKILEIYRLLAPGGCLLFVSNKSQEPQKSLRKAGFFVRSVENNQKSRSSSGLNLWIAEK